MTTAPAQDEERAAFEAWANENFHVVECEKRDGRYVSSRVAAAYDAWQARATAAEGWVLAEELLIAVEFGYVRAERGQNLQSALDEARALIAARFPAAPGRERKQVTHGMGSVGSPAEI